MAWPQPPTSTPTAIICATKRNRAEALRIGVSGLACCYQCNDAAWAPENLVSLLKVNLVEALPDPGDVMQDSGF
jgi:hypothetical protein